MQGEGAKGRREAAGGATNSEQKKEDARGNLKVKESCSNIQEEERSEQAREDKSEVEREGRTEAEKKGRRPECRTE